MKRRSAISLFAIAIALISVSCSSKKEQVAVSPDGRITVYAEAGKYLVKYLDNDALTIAKVGYDSLAAAPELKFAQAVNADYTMLMGKRSHCTNQANEYTAALDPNTNLIFRVYNNGIAFRYQFHNVAEAMAIPTELTSYEIQEGTRRWFMQWCESYEGFFTPDTTAKQKAVFSFSGTFVKNGWCCRWSYPALMQPSDSVFVLLSESGIGDDNSASCLWNDGDNIEIFNVRPDKNETEITGSYLTPWRVAIIGNLADIVESTLITDVADDCKIDDTKWIEPGVVSWIYWAYNHGSNDYNIIKKYVDLAVSLKLPYALIDAEWDEMKDGKTIEDAVRYAVSQGVKPLIWYSSSIGWIDGAPGPKFRLNKPEDREKEFAWLEKIGVAGVKIDFFSGDNQFNMNYCIDLLQSAANHHLTVNFHGATLPRGWQRTYPNLLSTEAVYGAEWYNNVPTFTNKAAAHNATLPFTRNVVGSMDYTPCAFSDSQHPHITTHAHELALTVLFESGLQHLADRPESLMAQPVEVRDFFGQLPAAWDETKFVGGYPADYAVVARQSNGKWYVAGINGTDNEREIAVNLDFIKDGKFTMFTDSGIADSPWTISNIDANNLPKAVKLLPRGGFVIVQN